MRRASEPARPLVLAAWCRVVQNEPPQPPPLPAMTIAERVRFTISVEDEVYEAFADLAAARGVSLSRCIGDWLRDTAEAAQITTVRMNEVRRSPQEALQAYLRDGVLPEMQRLIHEDRWQLRKRPPSSNTGGKSTKRGAKS